MDDRSSSVLSDLEFLLALDVSDADTELSDLLAESDDDTSIARDGKDPKTPPRSPGCDSDGVKMTTKSTASRVSSPCSVEAPLHNTSTREAESTAQLHLEDYRRRRNRESMARYRQQTREQIDALTTQETALQRILQQMLAHNKPILDAASNHTRTQLQKYQAQYTELVRAREALLVERSSLTDKILDHTQRQRAVQSMLEFHQSHDTRSLQPQTQHGHKPIQDPSRPRFPEKTTQGYWLQFLENEPLLFYEYVSRASCASLIRKGLTMIQQIHCALDAPLTTSVLTAQCLGWKAERSREMNPATGRLRIHMRCTKRIPRSRASLEQLQDRTWLFLNSPELIARVNQGSVTAVVAQQLDDNTIVLLRNSPDKTNHKRFRYFSLNARSWSRNGSAALVLMLVLDKQAHRTPGATTDHEIQWMNQGSACFRFSHVAAETNDDDNARMTQIEYTGTIECLTDDHAAHMMVANLSALLKWEHLVVPPYLLDVWG